MKVYEDYSNGIIDKQIFISVLALIQSFTFRRFIVGLPTNALNKIFMSLYDKVEQDNYLFSIQKSLLLRSGVQRFPRNTETINALKEKDVYNIKSKNRTYLLERLENHQNNEPVAIEGNSDITIEHIFPQNQKLENKHIEYISLEELERLVLEGKHPIDDFGNLVLLSPGMNSEYSNMPYKQKKGKYDSKTEIDSLKSDLIFKNTDWDWKLAVKHRNEMIDLIENYLEKLKTN